MRSMIRNRSKTYEGGRLETVSTSECLEDLYLVLEWSAVFCDTLDDILGCISLL